MSLDAIREKLDTARAKKRAWKVFGANHHRFELEKPLAPSKVAAFEKKLGIVLPADYRAFLTEIGNGGAGPFYGVFPLGTMDEGKVWKKGRFVGDPASPFPHVKAWNWPKDRVAKLRADETGTLEQEYWVPIDGAIPICHEGCALRDWLVVTGKEAGHVWHDATADFAGWWPWVDPKGKRRTFAGWYEAWLDSAIAGTRFPDRRA